MKVLVTGATGFVGTPLVKALWSQDHHVVRLLRKNATSNSDILWDPDRGLLEADALEGIDAVIHLAGENISSARWTPSVKKKILESRVRGTKLLSETLARLKTPPKTFISASAIGYYGDRANEVLTEESAPGKGFLAEVCVAWEKSMEAAKKTGIRTASTRFGIILSPNGGALKKMLLPFRLGLGGPIGDGKQYWSWISLDDVVGGLLHVLKTTSLSGPVNFVSPETQTNAEFTRALGEALHRPAVLPLPAFAARIALGEMANELLLASNRVEPRKLAQSGYAYKHPTLKKTLQDFFNP